MTASVLCVSAEILKSMIITISSIPSSGEHTTPHHTTPPPLAGTGAESLPVTSGVLMNNNDNAPSLSEDHQYRRVIMIHSFVITRRTRTVVVHQYRRVIMIHSSQPGDYIDTTVEIEKRRIAIRKRCTGVVWCISRLEW